MDRRVAISPGAQNRRRKIRKFFTVLFVLALILGAAGGTYIWQQREAEEMQKKQAQELEVKEKTIEALKQELGSKDSAPQQEKAVSEDYSAVKTIIENALKNKTYIEVTTQMTNPINVILAASEGLGERTPAQAVEDLKYLNGAAGEWSFTVPATTLEQWRRGSYARYVTENGIIGVSTDGYVAMFTLNTENRITDIFMSSNAELML